MTPDPTNERKLEHIQAICADPDTDRRRYYFDEVRLIHRALPDLDLDQVDTACSFLGRALSFPLLISSMTGGDHADLERINRNLATAAQHCGVALAVGSQRVMFTHPEARSSFALRNEAPDIPLLANLGAVQLNEGFGIEQARRAIEILEADGLYLHLNPLQEAIQPEGDTHFAGLAERIGEIASALPQPLLIKEVGAGIHPDDVAALHAQGIRMIDVAGAGGTSWSRIEHHRQAEEDGHPIGLLFQDWGLPTPQALRQLAPWRERGVTLIASGGIRNGLDMAKAMVLGASLCGLARPFLEPAMHSPEAVVKIIERLRREFITSMFLLGMGRVDALTGNASLLQD